MTALGWIRTGRAWWACLAAVAASGAVLSSARQQPVFRTATDLVAVPVSVSAGNDPVTDLAPEDFQLRDNGVLQTIELVADASAPIDVTVIVDTSGSVGPGVEFFRSDVSRLGALLHEADRVRFLTFDEALREAVHWSTAASVPSGIAIASRGGTALNDAIAAGLMGGATPGRRHVAIVLTSGPENSSAVDTQRIVDLAARSDVALFVYDRDRARVRAPSVLMPARTPGSTPSTRITGRLPSAFDPVVVSRSMEERRAALEQAAERTGGQARDYRNSVLNSVRAVLEEFRHGYVLYFRPSSAPDDTWHTLDIDVRQSGGREYAIRARPGYWRAQASAAVDREVPFVDPADAPDPIEPAPPLVVPPRSTVSVDRLRELIDRYDRGDHDALIDAITNAADVENAVSLLSREARRWVETEPGGSASRRRMVAAAAALDASVHALAQGRDDIDADVLALEATQRAVVVWGAALLAGGVGVSDAERSWYLAAIAALQGQRRFHPQVPDHRDALRVLAQAISRAPDEARHRWADARVLEQWVLLDAPGPRMRPDEVRKAFEATSARADGDLQAEMQLHLVARFLTTNTANEALGPIVDEDRRQAATLALAHAASAARLARDPFLVYMSHFFRARLHDRLDRRAEAEAAYRSALEVHPGAHSASMPLATLLFLRGEEDTARRLVQDVLTSPDAPDPYRVYHLQDYRLLPAFIAQMRAALRTDR